MPAPKGNRNAKGNRGGHGGPEKYKPEFIELTQRGAEAGLTDAAAIGLVRALVRG
jgi:hypothetical protein